MKSLVIRNAFFYELQFSSKERITFCNIEIFQNSFFLAHFSGAYSMLLSDNNIQNTKIIPLENARYSVLVIYSESKNLAESIQTNGTFFLVEDSQVEKIKNAKMEDLSFLDEDEYSEISDSYSDSELGNIDMSYSQKCENGLKAEVRNQFIEIIKNNKKTPKLNIQKAIDISQISDYREFFLNIEEKVSKFVPQEFHDTIHNMLYLETILVGCYFGSINGELSPDAAFFINDVARFAVVDGDKNSESELINRKNELKSIFASHLKENFIENKEYQDFFRRIILGKLYSLEVFNNMDGNQILQHIIRIYFCRFATKILSIKGSKISNQEKADLETFVRRVFGDTSGKLTGIDIDSVEIEEKGGDLPNEKENPESETDLESVLNKLYSLVGLQNVKTEIEQLINFLKVQKLRAEKGLYTKPLSRHFVFYGNPGTGKTTVARLLSQIFKSLGILSKGHLIETDRSGLVAGYVGQTALKVYEVVNSAIGGILFIDEAYSLSSGGETDFGQEAIDTLIKLMEDNREDLIVIVAGYPKEMEEFINSNPGLRSRFNNYINFYDYNPEELVEIFLVFVERNGYKITDSANQKLSELFTKLHKMETENFSNARLVRNIFEKSINKQANRIVELQEIDENSLSILEDSDIPNISELSQVI